MHPGRSANGTQHMEIILDCMPQGVTSHLLTQRGFRTMTNGTHSFVYEICPCCECRQSVHLPYTSSIFCHQSSTWKSCSVNYVVCSLTQKTEKGNFYFVSRNLTYKLEINLFLELFLVHIYMYAQSIHEGRLNYSR